MEKLCWHGVAPNKEQLAQALKKWRQCNMGKATEKHMVRWPN